jgi:hypothetical protein
VLRRKRCIPSYEFPGRKLLSIMLYVGWLLDINYAVPHAVQGRESLGLNFNDGASGSPICFLLEQRTGKRWTAFACQCATPHPGPALLRQAIP